MKTLRVFGMLSLFLLSTGGFALYGQSLMAEVPGDNFSLEGALELFKKSTSPEEFERLLNEEDSKVNNLDLNGDGYIDYIRVIDRNERNVHAFILQAIVSETESQDVAVIELEKLANGKAVLQITGDEDIYGIETIIEPTREVRVNAGTSTSRTVVNVWAWPAVQYVYSPYYSGWISPWGWRMRPVWWHTWRPVAYYEYNPYWHSYRPYYSVSHSHRIVYAQHIYRPHRTTSVIVHARHNKQIDHYRSSHRDDGRNRYNNGRSDGHQRNDRNVGDRNGRSVADDAANPRSDVHIWNESKTRETKRPVTSRDGYSSSQRSISPVRSNPDFTQRRGNEVKREDLSNRPSGDRNNNASRQQMLKPNNGNSSNVWRQERSKGTIKDSRSIQPMTRPAPTLDRGRSFGNAPVQRGNREIQKSGPKKSAPIKRGNNK